MLKKTVLAAVLALPALALPALASAAPYLIAGGATGSAELDDIEATYFPGTSLRSDDSFTRALVGIGMEVNPNLGLEALYLTEAEATVEDSTGTMKDTLTSSGLQFALLGKAPLTPQFSLFGKLSANYMKVEWEFVDALLPTNNFSESDSKMQLGFGAGAHFQASDAVGLRLGFERIQFRDAVNGAGDSDLDQTSLALTFAF